MEERKKQIKLTLKAVRVNMGKTQEEMSSLFGVTKDTLSNWENHKTYPTIKDIPIIEKVTGLNYNDIIFLPSDDV
ncbi:MAG: helix-turn-helix transcriptional regulator [Bacilli bacterium]